jgi:hypothetical protein
MKKNLFIAVAFTCSAAMYSQVGINTNNPQATFHVDAGKDNPATGVPTTAQQSNDFVVTSTGATGIATIAPTNKLHVVAASNPLRLNGLVNAQKTDSLLTVDASTGVVRMRSINSISGNSSNTCNPSVKPGTISHNQPYGCAGYDPGVFTSSAADAGIGGTVAYTWQQSTDGGTTWTSASGTNNVQNYDPPTLTIPTKYRRAAANYCGVVYTNTVDIAIDGASSGIVATPCAIAPGESTSLSIGLFTGSSVISWSVSPSSGMTFSSTNTTTTTLTASSGAAVGSYTVTATITSPGCGNKSFTKTITVVPAGVNVGNLKTSCKEILDSGLSAGNGTYWIDPDGSGNAYCAEQVYCNMTDNGGGWTLILKSMNNNSDFQYSSGVWASGATFNTSDLDITNASTANALYKSYNYLSAKEFWVDFLAIPDPAIIKTSANNTSKYYANTNLNANVTQQEFGCKTQWPATIVSSPNAYNGETGAMGLGINIGTSANQQAVRFGIAYNNEFASWFGSAESAAGIGVVGFNSNSTSISYLSSGIADYQSTNQDCGGSCCTGPTWKNFTSGGFYKAILWAR